MGRHSKPNPKKISFLGSTAGAFGALLVAGGIFAATQILDGPEPNVKSPEQAEVEPVKITPMSGALDTVINGPSATPDVVTPNIPGPATPPTVVIPPVVVPPVRADVNARVSVPPVIDTEVGVDIDLGGDVPLLGPATEVARSAVEPLTDVLTEVTKPVAPLIDGVGNLLK